MGQIRVAGQYIKGICQPTGFENKDISALDKFKTLCSDKFTTCLGDGCWAGGDTGGWF